MESTSEEERPKNRISMVPKTGIARAVVGVLVFGAVCVILPPDISKKMIPASEDRDVSVRSPDAAEHSSMSYESAIVPIGDWKLNYRFESTTDACCTDKQKRIFGGIVPHHMPSQAFIAEMFSLLESREHKPRTIVILSPNHTESGEPFIQTGALAWRAPDGIVTADTAKAEELMAVFPSSRQDETLKREHGVYTIIPFVQHFLPEANIVPITLRFEVPEVEQKKLVNVLSNWLKQNDDTVVIASIDFSHGLPTKNAKQKDAETREAMQTYDTDAIARYRSDHIDSPVGLVTILKTMQSVGATRQSVLRYDNSGETFHRPHAQTTSHFLVAFTGEE